MSTDEIAFKRDFDRGNWDIEFFAKRFLDVQLHPGQVRFAKAVRARTQSLWRAAYLTVCLSAGNRAGKAQPVDEPVLTPDGWRLIGSLKVGDQVIAGDGTPTRVTGVFPQGVKPIFGLTFDDGAMTRSTDDHLWLVKDPVSRFRRGRRGYDEWRVAPLRELRAKYGDSPSAIHRWAIPVPGAVEFTPQSVPLDPYALGLLIGDGSMTHGFVRFSTEDPELVEALRVALPGVAIARRPGRGCDYQLTGNVGGKSALHGALRSLGLMGSRSEMKFVPPVYLQNSPEVRLAILQGLMDSDGTVGIRGQADFSSTSEQLACDVVALVRSLGGKATKAQRQTYFTYRGVRKPGQVSYRVTVRQGPLPLFRLKRKADRALTEFRHRPERIIRSIEPVGDAEAVCISIDHPDRTYVTNDYIVTHNTLALAIVILHSMIYKIGMQPPKDRAKDYERWMKAEYTAFHFAIRQEIADLVYWELVKLLSGIHEAQKSGIGCPLTNDIPQAATWDKKYLGEYRWFVLNPVLGGAELHFRTSVEKAMSSLGRNMHLISFDECGFEPNLEFIVNEVLELRRLQTGGQLLLISTPTEGITMFADMWETGNPEAPDRRAGRYSVRMSTRENVGFGLDRLTFDRLVEDMQPDLIPQNIDGYFLEGRDNYFPASSIDNAFVEDLPELQPAAHRHQYVQGVDAALTDASWAIVLDCTDPDRVVGVKVLRHKGRQTTDSIIALTTDNHNAYTSDRPELHCTCATAFDATGWGGKMFKDMLTGISPLRAIEFGGSRQKKLKLLGDLKTMLDTGRLVMPRSGLWLQVRRQLAGYKLADRKIEQDAVMALACAVAEVRRTPPVDASPVPFNYFDTVAAAPRRTSFWDHN